MEINDIASAAERAEATKVYNKALRSGELVKPTDCAWCGRSDKVIHGHHPDYARPLMVVWLCAPCHREHHKKYRNERVIFGRS